MERIAAGEWKPGQAIPNESDLARDFGVSSGTVRRALDLMESGRLLTRRQGRGTFITDPTANGLADPYCNVRGLDGEPVAGRIEVTEIAEVAASQAECVRLQLRAQDPVWRVGRVRRHQGKVFMCETASLPVSLFPQLREGPSCRIVTLAHRSGLLLGPAEERVSLGAASRDAAEQLSVAPGSPVLMLDRVVRTIDGQPAEWRVAQCHLAASNYYLANLTRGGPTAA